MGEGREGDWECSGCKNRNYAFRTFCNRCKQPRLFVDTKTPSHSKWLPRIGDWICTGCTNNNYASRDKCNKCGQPREMTAMPAIAIHGASIPTYSPYFARELGIAVAGNDVSSSVGNWPLSSSQNPMLPIANSANQPLLVPKGWRNGDWICSCGFHNYSSRAQCKNCDASLPPALGTKRLASEESVGNFESKRLNSGNQHMHPILNQIVGTASDPLSGAFAYPSFGLGLSASWQVPFPFSYQASPPAIVGKGAKHWRDGDWMCTNCNNHNYASRAQCNRCKTERDADTDTQNPSVSQTVDAA